MRSLQFKFSALVITLLTAACVGLAWMATAHERGALEEQVRLRGTSLARHLATTVKIPVLEALGSKKKGEARLLDVGAQVTQAAEGPGILAARVLDASGRVLASTREEEIGVERDLQWALREDWEGEPADQILPLPDDVNRTMSVIAPVFYGPRHLGEAQVELDLAELIDPVVAANRRQLTALAVLVVILGVAGGILFVSLLVGPLRRLRAGVERMTDGALDTRVPPTSKDEVGELTRAFNEMGESLEQKKRIQNAFGRYASDYVLNTLLESSGEKELAGAEREVTILFADIRSFTRLSEGLAAEEVVKLLNEVFQLASDRILARGGTIDKFIGDSVMAYFGAPVPNPDHATDAVQAAIELEAAIQERNQQLAGSGHPVQVGFGIHTGRVVVGTIGSDRRTDFTAIGDAVNVAHRLEKLARPGEILVSEAVQRRVRDIVKLNFEGERQLSGRVEPVHVYSVASTRVPALTVVPRVAAG